MPAAGGRRRARILVLVALGDEHRTYREVVAAGVAILRPHVRTVSTRTEDLAREVTESAPQLVVCDRPEGTIPLAASVRAWVELPLAPTRPMQIRVDERRWTASRPTLEALLEIIDSLEESSEQPREEGRQHDNNPAAR